MQWWVTESGSGSIAGLGQQPTDEDGAHQVQVLALHDVDVLEPVLELAPQQRVHLVLQPVLPRPSPMSPQHSQHGLDLCVLRATSCRRRFDSSTTHDALQLGSSWTKADPERARRLVVVWCGDVCHQSFTSVRDCPGSEQQCEAAVGVPGRTTAACSAAEMQRLNTALALANRNVAVSTNSYTALRVACHPLEPDLGLGSTYLSVGDNRTPNCAPFPVLEGMHSGNGDHAREWDCGSP